VSQALSNEHVLRPLSPELALVDPELARLARERLEPPGETPSSPGRASSPDQDVGETRPRESWVSGVDDARRLEKSLNASSSSAAEARSGFGSANVKDEPRAPSRSRRRGGVFLGALGVALAAIAVYALAPDSTVREEASNRAPKSAASRIDRHGKPRKSTKPTARAAGASAPRAPRHSGVLGVTAQARASSERPRPFSTRVFIWPAVSDATFYKVEFFRRGLEVFNTLSSRPRLELPTRWVYRGRTYQLAEGTYAWKVSPAFGPRSRLRYGNPIVRSTWVAQR
jgi:hypothetical protein